MQISNDSSNTKEIHDTTVLICTHENHKEWLANPAAVALSLPLEEHLRDSAALHHPSYFESTAHYDMLVFRGLSSETVGQKTSIDLETVPTTFFIYDQHLVIVRARNYPALDKSIQKHLNTSNSQSCKFSPVELTMKILNDLIDSFLALRQPLSERLSHWQQELLNPRKPFRNWYALLEMRDQFRRLDEFCEQQLDALQEWSDARIDDSGTTYAAHTAHNNELIHVRSNDLKEHVTRVMNHARRLEASAESSIQMHFAATSYRTSEIMRILTVITAIFMPLNLITGIFGMNFDHIPWLHEPNAIWGVLGFMALVVLGMWGFFRRRRFVESRDTDARKIR